MGPSYQYNAHVARVIDGDTVVLDVDCGFSNWEHGLEVRLFGINAPEKNTTAGKQAKAYLTNYLPAYVIVETMRNTFSAEKREKYGRWLGIIYVNGENVNERLVDKGHAVHWDGKGPRP